MKLKIYRVPDWGLFTLSDCEAKVKLFLTLNIQHWTKNPFAGDVALTIA